MRLIVNFLVGIFLSVILNTAYGQNTNGATSGPPQPLLYDDQQPAFELPATWPNPIARPEGSPEVVAGILAKKVLNGGPETLAALERAALESGISILGENDEIKFAAPENTDLGMAVGELELALTAELLNRKSDFEFLEFKDFFDKNLGLGEMDLPDLLVKTITEYCRTSHPGRRFLAYFVRSIGWQSDGAFDNLLFATPGTKICSAQALWLGYIAAGQAFAGMQKPQEPLDFLLPAPRHGPMICANSQQNSQRAMRQFLQIVKNLGQGLISKFVQRVVASGANPTYGLMVLTRQYMYRLGLSLTGSLNSPPLIRTKTKGQEGGDRDLALRLSFRIGDRLRSAYQKAMASYGAAAPVHPNGTYQFAAELSASTYGDQAHIANKNWEQMVAPGLFRLLIRGDKQPESFTSAAIPTAEKAIFRIAAIVPSLNLFKRDCVVRTFDVPVRNWREPGVHVIYFFTISGNGSFRNADGGSTTWRIHRAVNVDVSLGTEMPMNLVNYPGATSQIDTERFLSWMSLAPSNVRNYHVNDSTLTTHPSECGSDGSLAEWADTVVARPASNTTEGKLDLMGSTYSYDKRNKVFAIHIELSKLRVPTWATHRDPIQGQTVQQPWVMDLFKDITFDDADEARISVKLPDFVWNRSAKGTPGGPNLPGIMIYRSKFDTKAKSPFGDANGAQDLSVSGEVVVYSSPPGK